MALMAYFNGVDAFLSVLYPSSGGVLEGIGDEVDYKITFDFVSSLPNTEGKVSLIWPPIISFGNWNQLLSVPVAGWNEVSTFAYDDHIVNDGCIHTFEVRRTDGMIYLNCDGTGEVSHASSAFDGSSSDSAWSSLGYRGIFGGFSYGPPYEDYLVPFSGYIRNLTFWRDIDGVLTKVLDLPLTSDFNDISGYGNHATAHNVTIKNYNVSTISGVCYWSLETSQFEWRPYPVIVVGDGTDFINGKTAGSYVHFTLDTPIPQGAIITSANVKITGMDIGGGLGLGGTGLKGRLVLDTTPLAEDISTTTLFRNRPRTTAYTSLNDISFATKQTISYVEALQELVNAGEVSKIGFFVEDYDGESTTNQVLYASSMIVDAIEYEISTTCTVSYDANGGVGTLIDPNSPYESGSTVTVLGAGLIVREGYFVEKWNTAADGSGTDYFVGDIFTITSNVTLYAQWMDNILSLPGTIIAELYDVNDEGTWILAPSPATEVGRYVNIGKYGCGFACLFTLPTSIPAGCTVVNATITLTGLISYNNNVKMRINAEVSNNPSVFISTEDYKIRRGVGGTAGNVTPHPIDWDDLILAEGTEYESASVTLMLQDVLDLGAVSSIVLFFDDHDKRSTLENNFNVLHPDHPPVLNITFTNIDLAYTVTYNSNNGTGSIIDLNSPYLPYTPVTVLTNTFVKVNCSFVEWNTSADGSGTSYLEGASFAITENTVLYAIWARVYKINQIVHQDGSVYICKVEHTSSLTNKPGEGVDWETYWGVLSSSTFESFTLTEGAGENKILTSDSEGNGTWQDPATEDPVDEYDVLVGSGSPLSWKTTSKESFKHVFGIGTFRGDWE